MKNYYKALASFQQECPVLLKDTEGYGYKYVDLTKIINSINPLLKELGLGFTQKIGTNPETGQSCLTTTVFHVASGESDSTTVDIPLVDMKGQNIYQAFGSGTTYFRRYQLSSQLGVISDKDLDAYGEQVSDIKPVTVSKSPKQILTSVDNPLDVMFTIKKGLDQGKDWDKDIVPWLKKNDPKMTIKKINQIKSELNGQAKTRVTQKS